MSIALTRGTNRYIKGSRIPGSHISNRFFRKESDYEYYGLNVMHYLMIRAEFQIPSI